MDPASTPSLASTRRRWRRVLGALAASGCLLAILARGWPTVGRIVEYETFTLHDAPSYDDRQAAFRLAAMGPEISVPVFEEALECPRCRWLAHEMFHRIGHPRARGMPIPGLVDCDCETCTALRAWLRE